MVNPPFKPTEEQKVLVGIMSACGSPQDQIAARLKIDPKTLRKAFRKELSAGKAAANAMVAQSLFKHATGAGKSAVTAAIFWLKTQAGWKETPQTVEMTGKGGGPIQQSNLTGSEYEEIARRLLQDV